MIDMKRIVILSVFLGLILVQAVPIAANNPDAIDLDYDFGTQTLTVEITHFVVDVVSHRIDTIIIEKNSVLVTTRSYASQDSTTGMSDTFSITAVHGDVIRVDANCSQVGGIEGTITVIDPSVSTTTTPIDGTPMDMTMIIAVAVIALGVIAVAFAFMRRR